jgi:hypothetical protein
MRQRHLRRFGRGRVQAWWEARDLEWCQAGMAMAMGLLMLCLFVLMFWEGR